MASFSHPNTFNAKNTTHRKNALLAVNDPKVGAAYVELLHELDYEVSAAADAQIALALSQETTFDLSLCDLALTGAMDGLDLALGLRRRFDGMSILLLTDGTEAYRRGVEKFAIIRKPIPDADGRLESLLYTQ